MFNIIVLGITSLLTDISSEMVYPLLPLYLATRLGAGPAVIGLIEGMSESLASLVKVFSGYFSDRLKARKPFVVLGYSGSAVGKLLLYLSVSWWFVLAGRLIDRFGKGVRTAPRDALIVEGANPLKRGAAFGLHRTMDTLGAIIGAAAAYFLITRYHGDFQKVFLVSLIPAVLGVLFLFLVKEKVVSAVQAASSKRPQLKWGLLDRRLKLFLAVTFVFTLGNSSNQFLLLRAKDLGNSFGTVILMYLAYNLTYVLVAYPAARLSDRIGRKKLLVIGYLFYGLVYFGFALNRSPAAPWLLFCVYGLYIGCTEGVEKALVADLSPQQLRATAIGLHATLVGIGLLPASVLAGIFWKAFGASAPFYFGGCMGLISSIALWLVLRGL